MNHRILVSDGLSESGLSLLRASADVTVNPKITADELIAVLPDYHALVVRSRTKVNAKVIEAGKNLKVIGRAGVGVDNIDVAAAAAKGITVVNSPLAATIAVAEFSLALMLSLARAVPKADAALKKGEWLKSGLVGAELHGKTLGLIGIGRIGTAVAERARAFGMSVLAYDPYLSPDQIRERGGEPVDIHGLFERSDYISIHAPLADGTHRLIDAAAIDHMKRGVYLISAARGGVIDEDALLAALNDGRVAGAALDVFASEPPGQTPLVQHPNVVGTPHVGAQTREAQARAGQDIAEEVLAALDGQPLRWQVS